MTRLRILLHKSLSVDSENVGNQNTLHYMMMTSITFLFQFTSGGELKRPKNNAFAISFRLL